MQDQKKSKTTFLIDRSKWRCGGTFVKSGNGPTEPNLNCRGKGSVQLLNAEGFMCCLGQIAEQLGYPEDWRDNADMPEDFQHHLQFERYDDTALDNVLFANSFNGPEYRDFKLVTPRMCQSLFTDQAVQLNDDEQLDDVQRERQLERLAEKYGLRIEFTGEYVKPDVI